MSGTLLITGANGFLARAVARQAQDKWELAALVRPGTDSCRSSFHTTHTSTNQLIADLKKIDVVIHLAACIPSPINISHPELISVNVDLVKKLTLAYPEARHVLASSVSTFGIPITSPLTIHTPPNKPNKYGLSKLAAEDCVRKVPNYVVIRFSSLIGVGMKMGSFIPSAVLAARAGKIHIRGSGERLQNYLDIDVAASMCLRAAVSKRSFSALGISKRSYSNNEIATILAGLTGAAILREGEDQSPSYVYEFLDSMDSNLDSQDIKESLRKMVKNL